MAVRKNSFRRCSAHIRKVPPNIEVFPMRIRWRGLELPSKVIIDPKFKSDVFGRFTVELKEN